jgi:hypothetical protein
MYVVFAVVAPAREEEALQNHKPSKSRRYVLVFDELLLSESNDGHTQKQRRLRAVQYSKELTQSGTGNRDSLRWWLWLLLLFVFVALLLLLLMFGFPVLWCCDGIFVVTYSARPQHGGSGK